MMEDLGYEKESKYPHDYAGRFVEEEYLPEKLRGRTYSYPIELGRWRRKSKEGWSAGGERRTRRSS